MKRHIFLSMFLMLSASTFAVSPDAQESRAERKTQFSAPLVGAWQEEGGRTLINFEAGRITLFDGSELSFRGLIRQEEEALILRNDGIREVWKASLQQDGSLRIENGSTLMLFHKLDNVPPAVRLEPLPLGPSEPLSAGRIQAIKDEIASRFELEQKILKTPGRKHEYAGTVDANHGYLVDLIREVGWIDADRFGNQTSVYATIIAKHTNDLRLMMTALPFAETAFRNSGDGQTYAVLYDAFQLRIGNPQRYGTQVGEDESGNPFLLPVENDDLEAVNERLRAMGVPTLDQYLTDLRNLLYPGKEIRIAKEETY